MEGAIEDSGPPIVRLIQTTKLPPLHQKLVQAKVCPPTEGRPLMLFEQGEGFMDKHRLQVAEAAVKLPEKQEMTLIVQNFRNELS